MYLVFDIGGTAIKYCWMNEAGEIFNKQEILSTAVDSCTGSFRSPAHCAGH